MHSCLVCFPPRVEVRFEVDLEGKQRAECSEVCFLVGGLSSDFTYFSGNCVIFFLSPFLLYSQAQRTESIDTDTEGE